jgi:hypothetical protein
VSAQAERVVTSSAREAIGGAMPLLPGTGVRFLAAVLVFGLALAPRAAGVDPVAQVRDHDPDEAVLRFLREYLAGSVGPDKSTIVALARVESTDLRAEQLLAYVGGRSWCGTSGCLLLIISPVGSSYRVVGSLTVWPPIRALNTNTNGRADLRVWVQGGGIQPGYEVHLAFNGTAYPGNASMLPPAPRDAKTAGRVLFAEAWTGPPLY